LVNQSHSSTLVEKTPHEEWNGKKPSLKHLKGFGCDAYVHVLEENRSKLDVKVKKFIFISYKDCIKGYKLWTLVTKKTMYCQDVVIREVKYVPKKKFLPREKELEIIQFDLKNEENDST